MSAHLLSLSWRGLVGLTPRQVELYQEFGYQMPPGDFAKSLGMVSGPKKPAPPLREREKQIAALLKPLGRTGLQYGKHNKPKAPP